MNSIGKKLPQRIFACLPMLPIARSDGQVVLCYRYQIYDEDDGRIDVEAHYLDDKNSCDTGTTFGLRYAVDSLSGATPAGTHSPLDDSNWNFQKIDDRRTAPAVTYGIGLSYSPVDDLTLNLQLERYEMSGRDPATPDIFFPTPLLFLTSSARVSPRERGNLAKKVMAPDQDPLGDARSDHIYFSREASLGGHGVGGGGYGCNRP